MKFKLAGIKKHSVVDGQGVRLVFFLQGCPHHCKECHNPDTWDPTGGEEYDTADAIEMIRETRYVDGITLSGGDPMLQPAVVKELAQAAKEAGLNVWCYTGWTFEKLIEDPEKKDALTNIDVLVDGPFVIDLKTDKAIYRGSSNQRLIDVQASLEKGSVLEISI